MKLDFTKADGIIEVTQVCSKCNGTGQFYHKFNREILACPDCAGRGKIVSFMTPKAIREMIKEEGEPK